MRLTGSPIAIHRESHIQYLKYRRTEDPHSVQVASPDERPGTRGWSASWMLMKSSFLPM